MPDDDPQLAMKAEAAISKKDVEIARRKAEIAAIERQARTDAWSHYIEFITAKALGLMGLIVGVIEYVDPNILSIILKRPDIIAGLGAGLLFGRKEILAWLARTIKKISEEKP